MSDSHFLKMLSVLFFGLAAIVFVAAGGCVKHARSGESEDGQDLAFVKHELKQEIADLETEVQKLKNAQNETPKPTEIELTNAFLTETPSPDQGRQYTSGWNPARSSTPVFRVSGVLKEIKHSEKDWREVELTLADGIVVHLLNEYHFPLHLGRYHVIEYHNEYARNASASIERVYIAGKDEKVITKAEVKPEANTEKVTKK